MPVALLQAYHRLDMATLQAPDSPSMAACRSSSQEQHQLMHYTALARLPACLVHYSCCLPWLLGRIPGSTFDLKALLFPLATAPGRYCHMWPMLPSCPFPAGASIDCIPVRQNLPLKPDIINFGPTETIEPLPYFDRPIAIISAGQHECLTIYNPTRDVRTSIVQRKSIRGWLDKWLCVVAHASSARGSGG